MRMVLHLTQCDRDYGKASPIASGSTRAKSSQSCSARASCATIGIGQETRDPMLPGFLLPNFLGTCGGSDAWRDKEEDYNEA